MNEIAARIFCKASFVDDQNKLRIALRERDTFLMVEILAIEAWLQLQDHILLNVTDNPHNLEYSDFKDYYETMAAEIFQLG